MKVKTRQCTKATRLKSFTQNRTELFNAPLKTKNLKCTFKCKIMAFIIGLLNQTLLD